jgi:hypothetical protein
MTIQLMEHVGLVELGLELQGEGPVEGGWVDAWWARRHPWRSRS